MLEFNAYKTEDQNHRILLTNKGNWTPVIYLALGGVLTPCISYKFNRQLHVALGSSAIIILSPCRILSDKEQKRTISQPLTGISDGLVDYQNIIKPLGKNYHFKKQNQPKMIICTIDHFPWHVYHFPLWQYLSRIEWLKETHNESLVVTCLRNVSTPHWLLNWNWLVMSTQIDCNNQIVSIPPSVPCIITIIPSIYW